MKNLYDSQNERFQNAQLSNEMIERLKIEIYAICDCDVNDVIDFFVDKNDIFVFVENDNKLCEIHLSNVRVEYTNDKLTNIDFEINEIHNAHHC